MPIRSATISDAMGLAKVHVDTWRSTYRGIVSDAFLDGLTYERSAKGWERSLTSSPDNRVLVAEDAQGTVIGFASGGPNRDTDTPFRAELYAMYILEDRQGRGLGKALLRQFADAVAADGMDSLVVWALAANVPARRFYEAMHGVLSGSRNVEIRGQSLEEVAYGWADMQGIGVRN
jgi:GNAT superfamily N-acetyltransferase